MGDHPDINHVFVYIYFLLFSERLVEDITLGEWIEFFDDKSKVRRVTSGAIFKQ